MKIYFYLSILFLILPSSVYCQQDDTCRIWLIKNKNIYELTKIDKINTFQILGFTSGILSKKNQINLIDSKDYQLFISNEIQKYFSLHQEIKMENYVVQTIFLTQKNKKYCLSIFHENTNANDDCFSKRVLSQYGGGNSFFYLLFDLDQFVIIKEHINGW
jgi:hypothetical protein